MSKKTVYILIDSSGSMSGDRADAVNSAMRAVVSEAIPDALEKKDAELDIYFAVLTFTTDKNDPSKLILDWVLPKTEIGNISSWLDIEQEKFIGGTPTGEAIAKVVDDINGGNLGEPDPQSVAPAILLISDGMPNGNTISYEEALKFGDKTSDKFCPAYGRSNRIAIGINVDDDGRNSLKKFGRLSSTMKAKGYESYYDVSDQDLGAIVDLIKSNTIGLSLA